MFLRCGILREYSSVFILLLRLADVIANLTHNLRRQQVQALEVCQGNAGPSSSFLDPPRGAGRRAAPGALKSQLGVFLGLFVALFGGHVGAIRQRMAVAQAPGSAGGGHAS